MTDRGDAELVVSVYMEPDEDQPLCPHSPSHVSNSATRNKLSAFMGAAQPGSSRGGLVRGLPVSDKGWTVPSLHSVPAAGERQQVWL